MSSPALIHAQRNATWAANLVSGLVANGVADAVVSPGSRNTPLVLALDAALGDRTHVVLDERSAGFVALGLARASGRPVVLACTSGSAAAHYYPAVVEAYYSRIPLIVVTADRPPELHHNGAGQTIEQERLFGRFVEWFADLGVPSGETEPRTWAHAAAQAVSKAVGPVHLNVCFREPLWEAAASYAAPSTPALAIVRSSGSASFQLPESSRGVIVCGPRAAGRFPSADAAFGTAVHALAERLGWPVLADASSGVRCDASITAYDALLRASAFADSMRPQVVVSFGQRPASKALSTWLDASSATHILVNDTIHDPAVVAHQLVIADPTAFCEAQRGSGTGWLPVWRKAESAARRALDRVCSDGLWEGSIARTLGRTLPANALLHVASSMPVRDLESFAQRVPNVVSNRGANGIDGTIASACGAALAWDGPVVALLGDLAFVHDLGSLVTARALGVDVTLVVVDNAGGGIFDFLPIGASETRVMGKYFTTAQPVDVSALASAAGFTVTRVENAAELESALASHGGQRLVHVVVPRERNVARHRAAWTEVANQISKEDKS